MTGIPLESFLEILYPSMKLLIENGSCENEIERKVAYRIMEATFKDMRKYIVSLKDFITGKDLDTKNNALVIPYEVGNDFISHYESNFKKGCAKIFTHTTNTSEYIMILCNSGIFHVEPFHNGNVPIIEIRWLEGDYYSQYIRHTIHVSSWFCKRSIEKYTSKGATTIKTILFTKIYKYNDNYDVEVDHYSREDESNQFPYLTLSTDYYEEKRGHE